MINRQNIDEWLIRSVENDLSVGEQTQLNTFLESHPEFHADLNAYEKTVLTPNISIEFADKSSLRRNEHQTRSIISLRLLFAISVAASIIILIAIGFIIRNGLQLPTRQLVTRNNMRSEKNTTQPAPAESSTILHNIPNISAGKISSLIPTNHNSHIPVISSNNKNTNNKFANNPKENIVNAVTYSKPDTLHQIEGNDIMQVVYISNVNRKISQQEVSAENNDINYLRANNDEGKGVKMVTNILALSGNKNLANTVEKASQLTNKKYEISYTSSFLSFCKTFNSPRNKTD